MFTTIIDGKEINIKTRNRLGFGNFLENLKLTIDGVEYLLTKDDLVLDCQEMHDEPEAIIYGQFCLANGMLFSHEDSIKLQQWYIEWENSILKRENVGYRFPLGREDLKGGIQYTSNYFQALMGNVARKMLCCSPTQLGVFFTDDELKFAQQYIAFHPALHKHLFNRERCHRGARLLIHYSLALFMCQQAGRHIDGYRASQRYKQVYEANNLTRPDSDEEIKHVQEYEHVLDSPMIFESLDFYYQTGDGGLLDILELPNS